MTLCDLAQPFISCPQKRRRTEKNRGDQMRVNQPDPVAVQTASLNRVPHFAELGELAPVAEGPEASKLCCVP